MLEVWRSGVSGWTEIVLEGEEEKQREGKREKKYDQQCNKILEALSVWVGGRKDPCIMQGESMETKYD